MADYWHGGWAEQGGMLPGTAAAMTAKNAGGSYGPLNALADILGAYWQKRSKDKVNEAVDKFEAGFDADMAPAPQWQAPSVMDGLMSAQGLQEAQAPQAVAAGAPLSFQEYSSRAKGKRSKLMRDLTRKYGYGAVQEILPAVDEVINGKIAEYGNQRLGELSPQVFANGLTQQGVPEWYRQVMEYNEIAQATGRPTINAADYIQNLAMKMANVDAGGRIVQQVAPANGLPIGYNEAGAPVYSAVAGTIGKSIAPADAARIQETNRHNLASEGESRRHNLTNEGISRANAETSRAKYGLDREKYEYLRDNNLYGKKGNSGGLSQKGKGLVNSISAKLDEIDALNKGDDDEKARRAMSELDELIDSGYEAGLIDDDDKNYFKSIWRGKRFEYYKQRGDDDNAAMEASQIDEDAWKELYGAYGRQPYK